MFANKLSQREAEEYLEHIEVLSGELSIAMDAIVSRQLPEFEMSVHRQRLICATIGALPQKSSSRMPVSAEASRPADAELEDRIQEAALALGALNRRYSALLEHSGDTLKLFAGLFRTYAGPDPMVARQSSVSTWSCKI